MARKYRWLGDQHVEKDILDGMEGGDINSREELMKIAEEEGLMGEVIRWDVWDRVVQQAKADIEALGDLPPVSLKKECYVYSTTTGKLIGHYTSLRETAEAIGVAEGTVHHCCWKKVPLQRMELAFSYTPLTHREIVENYSRKGNFNGGVKTPRWVYRLSTGEFLGEFPDSKSVAEKFGILQGAVNYYVHLQKPFKKHDLIIRDTPIEDNEGRT